MRARSTLFAVLSLLAVVAAAGCNDSSAADTGTASSVATTTPSVPTTAAAAPTTAGGSGGTDAGRVAEFPIEYPPDRMAHGSGAGSTHELTADPAGDAFWITGQNESTIVKAALDGSMQTFEMPEGSGPHGIVFDEVGRLWVSLEFAGEVVRLDAAGKIVQTIDVKIACATCAAPLNRIPTASPSAPTGPRSGTPARPPGPSVASRPTAPSRRSP